MLGGRANNDDIKVLWEKGKTIVHLGSVVEEVDDRTTVPELRTTDLADLDKAMYTSNEHLLNLTQLIFALKLRRNHARVEIVGGREEIRHVRLKVAISFGTLVTYMVSVKIQCEPAFVTASAVLHILVLALHARVKVVQKDPVTSA
jgi:hypothetical protein